MLYLFNGSKHGWIYRKVHMVIPGTNITPLSVSKANLLFHQQHFFFSRQVTKGYNLYLENESRAEMLLYHAMWSHINDEANEMITNSFLHTSDTENPYLLCIDHQRPHPIIFWY